MKAQSMYYLFPLKKANRQENCNKTKQDLEKYLFCTTQQKT